MIARWSLLLATTAQLAVPACHADEFRVETDVYVGEAPQPVAETLTLFKNGVIYDFVMTEPREATVFDVGRGRIVLLASQSRTKAEITTEELVQFTAAIRRRASDQQQQPLFGTEFAGEFDEESLEVLLQGKNLVYRAKGVLPKTKVAVQQYREFADWYARLNAARPGNPPPFARLELNRQLAENGLIPDEIHRSLNLPGRLRDKQQKATSRHAFTWLLSTTDNNRIEEAGVSMAQYKKVSLREFWGLKELAANDG